MALGRLFDGTSDFYPTSRRTLDKMTAGIDWRTIESVLDPSAGKGDILDYAAERMNWAENSYRRDNFKPDIDAVEIDPSLRHVLKGKGYRVVHDDFLTFRTFKRYGLVLMNPPFSEGDKHLLAALELQRAGGLIVCLLNAETLRNPFSTTRKDLIRKLEEYDASIEYLPGEFAGAERKTGVEIALIKVNIPKAEGFSVIIEGLKNEENYAQTQRAFEEAITSADRIKAMVEQCNFEIRAGLRLIDEYEAMKPYIMKSVKEGDDSPALALEIESGRNHSGASRNEYIKIIRAKYWSALFMSDILVNNLTSKLQEEYCNKVSELRNYDFSLFNIYTIVGDIIKSTSRSIEETIIALFDEFSHKHHWVDETSKNIHYYNGWMTNKSWYINKKVIIPLHAWSWGSLSFYDAGRKLADIEKVFGFLDGGRTDHVDLFSTLERAKRTGQTKDVQLKFFRVTFYKKGTCHLVFTDLELLKKFNLYGSQRKGWLPPSYGKAHYRDMNAQEKAVVDSFDGGEREYERVLVNASYYLAEPAGLPMLQAHEEKAG
jgi:hypothetical protein